MKNQQSADIDQFRIEVRQWLVHNKPRDPGFLLPQTFMEVGSEQQLEFLREWQHKVWTAGYLGLAWPVEYGGGGMTPAHQQIVDDEMKRIRVPIMFNMIGLGWAGPLIIAMGSEREKQKYLKGILSAEDIWCQGFSEPEYGSDLGSAQFRATREGDEYVLNGTKIWTTMGDFAKYMILLARTSEADHSKYKGLSFFLAPMNVAGVEPEPIKKLTGEYGFTETRFTNARIPANCLMGREGQGWSIAMQTLQYERGAKAGAAGGLSMVPVLMADLLHMVSTLRRDGKPVLEDEVIRDQLVQLMIDEKALLLSYKRQNIQSLCTDYPHSLTLSTKLRLSEFARRMRQFAITLQGSNGALYVGDQDAIEGGFWQRAYFNNFSVTIGGGTSQIQTNIIGERVLGLPK